MEDEFDKTMKDIKEQLIDRIKRQQEEIERLNKELHKYRYTPKVHFKETMELRKENKKLHSIIKEVREYVKENLSYYYDEDLDESIYQDEISGNKILEILDKERNNEKD